ncbi:MAG: hypothetical protein IJ535_12740 [Pseudobutyrivibrio sp.]|uniref:hypothetical protein n=1 Tax=Pseudobutyrivibrio sp. TaxID=2014367 RepID=UPI0025CEF821|nr:hypothetical protein [Pseudobutyrivibrio sp.]MBQ8490639.1 hypothetical protein [Pseudobutyrivibrio sp.]
MTEKKDKQGDFCHRGNVNIGIEGTLVTEKQRIVGDFCHRGNVNIGIAGNLVTEKGGVKETSVTVEMQI